MPGLGVGMGVPHCVVETPHVFSFADGMEFQHTPLVDHSPHQFWPVKHLLESIFFHALGNSLPERPLLPMHNSTLNPV